MFESFTLTFCLQFATEDFQIPLENARLGWTMEGNINPITYEFKENAVMYFQTVQEGQSLPSVGNTYPVQNLPYPAVFSFGVRIDPGEYIIIMLWVLVNGYIMI